MSVLLTTTVCVDAQKPAGQMVIHLNRGDSGTRALRMIPVDGGAAVDLSGAAQAKVMAHPLNGGEDLLISCELGDRYADMVPTEALVASENEYTAQLVILDSEDQTIKSMPFTILVHANVYTGDAVEHTSKSVTAMSWAGTRLTLTMEDGTSISVDLSHTHPIVTSTRDGFMGSDMYDLLMLLSSYMDQSVKVGASPTFAGLTIGSVVISADGTMSGVRFI